MTVEVPRIAFAQALTNLLENAREAQQAVGSKAPIRVHLTRKSGMGVVEITDRGIGLPNQKDQVGEPFFTTKTTGTGLGVYVARAVAQGAGGGLGYDSPKNRMTVARGWFPEVKRRASNVLQSETSQEA